MRGVIRTSSGLAFRTLDSARARPDHAIPSLRSRTDCISVSGACRACGTLAAWWRTGGGPRGTDLRPTGQRRHRKRCTCVTRPGSTSQRRQGVAGIGCVAGADSRAVCALHRCDTGIRLRNRGIAPRTGCRCKHVSRRLLDRRTRTPCTTAFRTGLTNAPGLQHSPFQVRACCRPSRPHSRRRQ